MFDDYNIRVRRTIKNNYEEFLVVEKAKEYVRNTRRDQTWESYISEVVYSGVSLIIGTPALVSIRRDVADMAEVVMKPVDESKGSTIEALGGSSREGFGNQASDKDYMLWLKNHHLIFDLNHADQYDTEKCTLILMEFSKERPGFAMLRLLTHTYADTVARSCIIIKNGYYISSSLYRKNTLYIINKDSYEHGPCARSEDIYTKFDFAHSFTCKLWPPIATSFALRCQSCAWPPNQVLMDIINSGCHVVPIGSKGTPLEEIEWRISFSLAERKLVFCMNHSQLMCYGLLKILLKKVLIINDSNGEPLLCSYYMKTVLFWVIQNNPERDWNPSTLLSGFRLCVDYLKSCVYDGNLPNFFVPENNLFISKVFGNSQQILYERLVSIEKTMWVSHCHFILDYLQGQDICNKQSELNFELYKEIFSQNMFGMLTRKDELCFTVLQSAVRYLHVSNQSLRRIAVQNFTSSILRYTVFHLYNIILSDNHVVEDINDSDCHAVPKKTNKSRWRIMRACLKLLNVSTEMGFCSDKIYLALLLYLMGKNLVAIKYLENIKDTMTKSNFVCREHFNDERYIEEIGRLSWSEKNSKAVAVDFILDNSFIMIKELELELRLTSNSTIAIPPYVMTHMLLVLCYRNDRQRQKESLTELYFLLHANNGNFIPKDYRDISWQILGICQEVCGDHHEALESYQNALEEIPYNKIQKATQYRIEHVPPREREGNITCLYTRCPE